MATVAIEHLHCLPDELLDRASAGQIALAVATIWHNNTRADEQRAEAQRQQEAAKLRAEVAKSVNRGGR